ncbi:MAG: hypothetical protein SGARI_008180 [Bacillariaceae sp.]
MPSKKGFPNKKKSKSRSSGNESITEGVRKWTSSGKLEAKGLSKNLPDVAQSIRDDKLDENGFTSLMKKGTNDVMKEAFEKLKSHIPEELRHSKIVRLGGLEVMTGAEPLLCDLVRAVCGADENMSHAFAPP